VPQHVAVNEEREPGSLARPRNHALICICTRAVDGCPWTH
jgi:hypothetical protein